MPPTGKLIDLTGPPRLWEEPELTIWRKAAIRALADVDPSLRAPMEGDQFLRTQLANLLRAAPERVLVTAGVRSAAAQLLAGCADVVVERPTFLGVPWTLAKAGFAVGYEAWDDLPASGRSGSALWLTTPCRNPDGRTADPELVRALTEQARNGRRVICNTAYRWFAGLPELPDPIIQVGTLHKLAGPGSALGWIVADLDTGLTRTLSTAAPPLHWQRTWAYFLAAGGAERLMARHRGLADIRADFLAKLEITEDPPGEGPNVLLAVDSPEVRVVETLAQLGVRVSPGSAFDAGQPSIRVCLTWLAGTDVAPAARAIREVLSGLAKRPVASAR